MKKVTYVIFLVLCFMLFIGILLYWWMNNQNDNRTEGNLILTINRSAFIKEENNGINQLYYTVPEDFDGVIYGTITPNINAISSIDFMVKDDHNIIIQQGSVDVKQNWRIDTIGLSLGGNTITVQAIVSNGDVISDSLILFSVNPDQMENIDVDEEDSDGDNLINYIEDYYGTDSNKKDSDGDGLSDYCELLVLNAYKPMSKDSDNNGIDDGLEDYDGDGLTNEAEVRYGSDLTLSDSDFDGISDFDEIYFYSTNSISADTDSDGANDGWEIDNGFNPLQFDSQFLVRLEAEPVCSENPVTAGVEISVSGDMVQTISIIPVDSNTSSFISESISGYLGQAYNFEVNSTFDSALLQFSYDVSLGTIGDDFQPRIYHLNETTQEFVELENQTVTNGRICATVSHFSTYILLNKVEFDKVWDVEIKPPQFDEDVGEATLDIAFVIDYSLSMDENDPNQLFKELTKKFIGKLRNDKDQATIIKFIRRATLLCGLTPNKETLNTAIESISYDNGSGTYSGTDGSTGIRMAINELKISSSKHQYIIFITDGGDNQYTYSYKSLISEALSENVAIYTIGMGSASESVLRTIAYETGGKYYHATTSDVDTDDILDLGKVFEAIERETIDFTTDSNFDGIPDYFNDLICEGKLVLSNGSDEYKGIDFNFDSNENPSVDYDGDGIQNGDELIVAYNKDTGRVSLKLKSSPIKADTDGDGLIDLIDNAPLAWNICDRDLAMFAALSYEDGSKYLGSFYDVSNIDQDEYWLNFADVSELESWIIVNYVDVWTQAAKLDKFSATTYKNGDNVVIAYRGTNDGLWEWADNILCYGLLNYHAEESLAAEYAKSIYNTYVRGNSNVKLYITGHSLGGYLAQIGTASLVNCGFEQQLMKVSYFNGIGMKYNKSLFWTKNDEVKALKRYAHYQDGWFNSYKTTNGKLVSYKIYGDVVSMLGTHYGDEVPYFATTEARMNHSGKHSNNSSLTKGVFNYFISSTGLVATVIAASPDVAFYYGYYGTQSIEEYFCITHETDSFLYHLAQGYRTNNFSLESDY